jgi:hypothetical protein
MLNEELISTMGFQSYWNAQRHVKLFNRIGRAEWVKAYACRQFIEWVGIQNWNRLKRNMKLIMDGEK